MSDPASLPKVEKLTKWKNEPDTRRLSEDLQAAKPSHDAKLSKIKHWTNLMNLEGSAARKKVKNRSSVQPKLIRRQAEWRYSALSEPFLGSEKLFDVAPRTFEDVTVAEQNETLLNWQFNTKMNKVKFIDEYVRTCVNEGSVIVRLGWERETKQVTEQAPVYSFYEVTSQEEMDALGQALELKQSNPREFLDIDPAMQEAVSFYEETETAVIAEIVGYEPRKKEVIIQNRPVLQIMNPANVYIDPSCEGDIDKARFVVVSFETSQAELKKDPRYKNLSAVNWSGAAVLTQPDHETKTPSDFNFNDDLRRRIIAYEYWGYYDVHGNGTLVPIIATWVGDVMIRMEENPFPDEKPPFVVVPYLPVIRELLGEPDAEMLEDNQNILGAVTRGMIDLMGRSANSQQATAKGWLDPVNKRKYENGENYEFNPAFAPTNATYTHQYPEIPNSAITMLQLQNSEAEALTGVKSFSGGMSGDAYGDVAAGIKGILDAAAKREMNILRRLAQGLMQIGTKIAAMNAVFLSEEEVIRVTNAEFVTIRREDLKGNFDLIVDIATAEVDNAQSNDLGFMLQTIGPNMPPEMMFKMMGKIAKLKRMPDLAHEFMNWKPPVDPLAERAKELEIQKLELENEELMSKIELNKAKAQEALAAKAQKDLDFVEQESGTKHARDMQKQAGQARGNQDLEVTKAMLKSRKPEESKPDLETAIGYNQVSGA